MTTGMAAGSFYLLLNYVAPSEEPVPIGVLLFVPAQADEGDDRLYLRLRTDCSFITDPDAVEVLELLPADLEHKIGEIGPRGLVDYLEQTLSNVLRVTDRRPIALVGDPVSTLNELYKVHVSQGP
jgi:hypothetical protein